MNNFFHKLTYKCVSHLIVFPIYKFLFRGHLISKENIPKDDSFIMVSNHGSLLDPPILGTLLGEIYHLWLRQSFLNALFRFYY